MSEYRKQKNVSALFSNIDGGQARIRMSDLPKKAREDFCIYNGESELDVIEETKDYIIVDTEGEKLDTVTVKYDEIEEPEEEALDLSPVLEGIKNVEDAIYATESEANDDTDILKALEGVKRAVEAIEPTEVPDYADELKRLTKAIVDGSDRSEILARLDALLVKETPVFEIPAKFISGDRIKVEVDRIAMGASGTGGGGTTIDTSALATSAKQDAQTTLLTTIAANQLPDSHNVTVDNASLTVTAPAVADTGNTTTATLGNGGNFTGTSFDMNAYASWCVNVFADQASATNGFKVQWSDDNSNWDFTDQTTYVASVGNMVTFGRKARYVRVNYTNGTTPQGTFRVTAYAQPFAVRQTRKFIGTQLTDADTGQVVVAALQGHTTAGGGAWVDVKVKPSGALSVDATATNLDIRDLTATDVVTVTGGAGQTADVKVTLDGESVPVTGTFYQATQPVSATDLDIRNLAKAQDEVYAVLKTDAGVAYDARLVTAQANSGVDIGDVTINNASGANAVNIQDGGNTITVDGSVTATLSAETTKVIGTVNVSAGQSIAVTQGTATNLKAQAEVYQGGTAVGAAAPLQVSLANTGANATAVKVDGSAVTQPVSMATQTPTLATRTTGGLTTYHLVSAATTNATVVKASAGQLYGWYIYNSNAAARKVAFHNTASTPTAGASIYFTLMIPPSSGANVFSDIGMPFSSGIAITTVTGLADSDSAAVGANDLIINLWYA